MDINTVALIGRITADPELKHTESGKQVCSFSLAVSGYTKDETYFIPVTCWNKTAELLTQYVKKGNRIGVTGRISQRSYEHKEGGKRSIVEVIANQIQFLESKSGEKNQSAEVLTDEGIPF